MLFWHEHILRSTFQRSRDVISDVTMFCHQLGTPILSPALRFGDAISPYFSHLGGILQLSINPSHTIVNHSLRHTILNNFLRHTIVNYSTLTQLSINFCARNHCQSTVVTVVSSSNLFHSLSLFTYLPSRHPATSTASS